MGEGEYEGLIAQGTAFDNWKTRSAEGHGHCSPSRIPVSLQYPILQLWGTPDVPSPLLNISIFTEAQDEGIYSLPCSRSDTHSVDEVFKLPRNADGGTPTSSRPLCIESSSMI